MVKCFQDGVCIFTADDFLASTDGIKDVAVSEKDKALSEDASLYDLSGRKVTGTPRRGIYIKGGRKVLVKVPRLCHTVMYIALYTLIKLELGIKM